MPYDVTVHQRTAEIDRVRVYLRHPLNARYNKSYNSRAIANRLLILNHDQNRRRTSQPGTHTSPNSPAPHEREETEPQQV
ncbi:hypothetical protein TNCV_1421411 [Trichonephila clavipes]|nr:hypothetical protein TNCV_1421411 [Trichonephila clavipes]